MASLGRQDGSSIKSSHTRQTSYSRAPMPRRATRGPLDADDPLSPDPPPTPTSNLSTPDLRNVPIPASPATANTLVASLGPPPKDFSYILRPEIYHPLSQIDIPSPFRASRTNFPPTITTPLPTLLSTGHFRLAALSAARILTTSPLPTSPSEIFSLLYIRLACLTLINCNALAAQEIRCLEDINSSFYRDELTGKHLMPWELRVLAVRLQGDGRRKVSGYFELAREARGKVMDRREERKVWSERLADLGVGVANALVEMGDWQGAGRHLRSLRVGGGEERKLIRGRLALLWLRIGDLEAAKRMLNEGEEDRELKLLRPLVSMADGEYEKAVGEWGALRDESKEENAVVMQNLAVCLLYTGNLQEAQSLFEGLVDHGQSFHALTFNLSTVYELCTEKSRVKKLELAERVAAQEPTDLGWEKANLDFKL